MNTLVSLGETARPVKSRGLWLKSHVYLQGTTLHATIYIVAATKPVVVRGKLDLGPIIRAVAKAHRQLHQQERVGCVGGDCIRVGDAGLFPRDQFETIARTAVTLGKKKLMHQVSQQAHEQIARTMRAHELGLTTVGDAMQVLTGKTFEQLEAEGTIRKTKSVPWYKQVSRGVKGVVKSDVTRVVMAAGAVVYPPVGVAAYAAYEASRKGLEAYEKAEATAKRLKKLTDKAGKKTASGVKLGKVVRIDRASGKVAAVNLITGHKRLMNRADTTTLIRASFQADINARRAKQKKQTALNRARAASSRMASGAGSGIPAAMRARAAAHAGRDSNLALAKAAAREEAVAEYKSALNAEEALKRIESDPAARAAIAKLMGQGEEARRLFENTLAMARYSQDPKEKARAMKLVKIINLVRANQKYLQKLGTQMSPGAKQGETGLVIDDEGNIIPGTFVEQGQGTSLDLMLAAHGKVRPGYFAQIASCIGC